MGIGGGIGEYSEVAGGGAGGGGECSGPCQTRKAVTSSHPSHPIRGAVLYLAKWSRDSLVL